MFYYSKFQQLTHSLWVFTTAFNWTTLDQVKRKPHMVKSLGKVLQFSCFCPFVSPSIRLYRVNLLQFLSQNLKFGMQIQFRCRLQLYMFSFRKKIIFSYHTIGKNSPYILFVKHTVFRIGTRQPTYYKHSERKSVAVLQPTVSDRSGITTGKPVKIF